MMVRSSNLFQVRILFTILLFLTILFSQEGEIIPLSQKVGMTLDAEENLFYQVFTDINGFENAQFYELNPHTILINISFVEFSQQKTAKRKIPMIDFLKMKEHVDLQSTITDQDRKNIHLNLTYLDTDQILSHIKPDQFVKVAHRSGRTIRGTLKSYGDKMIHIQTPVALESIPIWDMSAISYRENFIEKKNWKLPIYGLTALFAVSMAEVWNEQTRPENEYIWHFRFLGSVLGLLAGSEVYRTVNVLISPKTLFSLTPEEMNKLKES